MTDFSCSCIPHSDTVSRLSHYTWMPRYCMKLPRWSYAHSNGPYSYSPKRVLCVLFYFKIILKDWIGRRAIPSVLMMCCLLHGSTAVLDHVWLTWGKRLATTAVVGCHPFGNSNLQRNKTRILSKLIWYLLNLWLQPSGSCSKLFCLVIFAHCSLMPSFSSLLLLPLRSSCEFMACHWFPLTVLDPFV